MMANSVCLFIYLHFIICNKYVANNILFYFLILFYDQYKYNDCYCKVIFYY